MFFSGKRLKPLILLAQSVSKIKGFRNMTQVLGATLGGRGDRTF